MLMVQVRDGVHAGGWTRKVDGGVLDEKKVLFLKRKLVPLFELQVLGLFLDGWRKWGWRS